MKRTLFAVLVMVAFTVLPVCTSVQAAEKTLTIGGIAFLTGPASQGGIACKQGWEIAVDKYNKAGGLKVGNDTYKINLIVEDDAMSPDQASTAATKLIKKDGAKFIVGPLIDALKTVVYPIASKNGVLMVIADSMNASGALPFDNNADVSPKKPLLIRTAYAYDEFTPLLLDYLKEKYPNVKKIALCSVAEKSSEMIFDAAKTMFEKKGYQRVGQLEQFAPDVQDFGPVMTRVLSSKPDAIMMPISTPITFGMCVKAAREQGFKGPMFTPTHQDIAFQAMLAGKGNDTDIFGMGVTLQDKAGMPPAFKEVEAEYLKKYPPKDLITDVFLVGYNGLWVLLQTIEKAKSVDPEKVLKTYEGLTKKGDLQTLWGPAYVGGKKSLGVNRTLCYPIMIDATVKGVSKNEKMVFLAVP
jgi:branched-chain amino acid transport system substrate-binding protein